MSVKKFFIKKIKSTINRAMSAILFAAASTSLSACSLDQYSEDNMIGVPVGGVGHYGSEIGVPTYLINGRPIGNNSGWGGGGGFGGSIALPRHPKGPFMITVKWETCDISHMTFINDKLVDLSQRCIKEWHESTIPVNFSVKPGNSGGMFIHFLPGYQVEAWVSKYGPASSLYPGPAYPDGPAPIIPPMPSRNPLPPTSNINGTTP